MKSRKPYQDYTENLHLLAFRETLSIHNLPKMVKTYNNFTRTLHLPAFKKTLSTHYPMNYITTYNNLTQTLSLQSGVKTLPKQYRPCRVIVGSGKVAPTNLPKPYKTGRVLTTFCLLGLSH